jgi:CRP/FNR family transcriptional regulator
MDTTRLLILSQFFQELSPGSVKKLAEICVPREVGKKESLFHEGQPGHTMYLLVRGDIQLYKSSAEGKEIVVKSVKPGEVFGEVILFEENEYPVSARALASSTVILLPKQQMLCLLTEEGFRNDFIRMLMKKQRYLTQRILYLTAYDLEERFFRYLSDQYGRKYEYHLNLSKRDMASNIGTIPETFSRLLSRLEREGKIVWNNKVLTLKKGLWG